MKLALSDAQATTRLGQVIAPLLAAGDSVLLYGPLGMGKSTLARGLIRALTTPGDPGADHPGRGCAQPDLHPGAVL